MTRAGLYIDSNLLLLLVVGTTEHDLIGKHRRLRGYTPEDYEILIDQVDRSGHVLVTPNTLTETSNLLAHHKEPELARLFTKLKILINEAEEVIVPSAQVSRKTVFHRLGLTDAALLEVATKETPILTVDFDLYIEAVRTKGVEAAVNFRHLQALSG